MIIDLKMWPIPITTVDCLASSAEILKFSVCILNCNNFEQVSKTYLLYGNPRWPSLKNKVIQDSNHWRTKINLGPSKTISVKQQAFDNKLGVNIPLINISVGDVPHVYELAEIPNPML